MKVLQRLRVSNILLFISFFYLLLFFIHAFVLHKTVYGDGIFYFSHLRSVVFDRDLQYLNEYTYFGASQPVTPVGGPGNKYSIGPALLWLPNYVFLRSIAFGSGYEFPYQLSVGLTSVFYALIGLLLLSRILMKIVPESAASLTIFCIASVTTLLFYGSIDPVNSHAVSFFTVALFLSLLFTPPRRWFAIGATLGSILLVRPQDAIAAILILAFLPRRAVIPIAKVAVGALLMFLPQLLVWKYLYGVWLASPYILEGEKFFFFAPHVVDVLFSPKNGLFTYSPIVFFAIFGFFLSWKNLNFLKKYVLAICVLQIYIISTWSSWNQGASFGIRMFTGTLPLLSFPLAFLMKKLINRIGVWPIFLSSISLSLLTLILSLSVLLRN